VKTLSALSPILALLPPPLTLRAAAFDSSFFSPPPLHFQKVEALALARMPNPPTILVEF